LAALLHFYFPPTYCSPATAVLLDGNRGPFQQTKLDDCHAVCCRSASSCLLASAGWRTGCVATTENCSPLWVYNKTDQQLLNHITWPSESIIKLISMFLIEGVFVERKDRGQRWPLWWHGPKWAFLMSFAVSEFLISKSLAELLGWDGYGWRKWVLLANGLFFICPSMSVPKSSRFAMVSEIGNGAAALFWTNRWVRVQSIGILPPSLGPSTQKKKERKNNHGSSHWSYLGKG
jgi:hypothetical protein